MTAPLGGRISAPLRRRVTAPLGRIALAAALLAAPGLVTALAAQDPTWSTCDPRPGRSCGGRQLTRAERVELEALHDAPSTRRETGPVLVPRDSVIPASLAVLGGPVRIAGRVEGSVLVLNGDLLLDSTAVVGGDVAVFGGRVTRVDGARTGPVRAEPDSVRYSIVDGRLTLTRRDDEVWRLLRRDDPRSSASLRLAAARTYNRVEGWPIEFGPRIRKRTAAGMIAADLYGIVRTGDRLDWTSANVGHDARLEFRPGQAETWSIAGRLYDVVTPVEDWQLSEVENGLASFIFTSDYRDHFDRHGAALELGWNGRRAWRLGLALRHEDWRPRRTLDPVSLLRADEPWRPNPITEAGTWRVGALTASYDTRSDAERPRTGWWLQGAYEVGRGTQQGLLPDGPAVGPPLLAGEAVRLGYGRAQFDLRRYIRLSPASQVNARVFLAGWVHGDPLPLQRRLSLSGPGGMPGFDFRRQFTIPDRLNCGAAGGTIAGSPALCDRVALASIDYRHDIRWLVDLLDAPRFVRRDGSGAAGWVAFVDAGRGWLMNPRTPRPFEPAGPGGLRGLQTSLGVGLELYQGGIYIAKGLGAGAPAPNVFLRLSRRF